MNIKVNKEELKHLVNALIHHMGCYENEPEFKLIDDLHYRLQEMLVEDKEVVNK